MKKFFTLNALLLLMAISLVACGGGSGKKGSSPASSSSTNSSSVASNVMEVGQEYPFTPETRITNTGTTELVVTKKYYWDSHRTVVVLQEGSATID